ncbi:AlbA family DNA-binding domain-containing protein [Pseudonocardia autotrophica]|uniref:AlbA family DNA-binding domain-containing protein n=2 Tax=Pseudonocardia TaxID=1847 RepID=UPI0018D50B94|nr:ATP-binding protein [Pseudonocardia autotrophica]
MTFTALHRILGIAPGPLTDDLLDSAVQNRVRETGELDFKSELPPAKGIRQTDLPKDIAAMANSGGGLIVFGIRESQKIAEERVDVGEFDETYERSLRSAAITAIPSPLRCSGSMYSGSEDTAIAQSLSRSPRALMGPTSSIEENTSAHPSGTIQTQYGRRNAKSKRCIGRGSTKGATPPRRWTTCTQSPREAMTSPSEPGWWLSDTLASPIFAHA